MLNHVRNALAAGAAAVLIYTISRIPLPELFEGDYSYEDDYWDTDYWDEPTPPKQYLITEEDHITDLL